MEKKEFKNLFSVIAKAYGFEYIHGGWFIASNECIIVLDLQASNFSDLYYLNIKIYIQGMFGNCYSPSKNLVKKDIGNIFFRQPQDYNTFFNLESNITEGERKTGLENLFKLFIAPLSEKAITKHGIKELVLFGTVSILPNVKKELDKL